MLSAYSPLQRNAAAMPDAEGHTDAHRGPHGDKRTPISEGSMATARTFPPSGDAREDGIKAKAGYVEYAVFSNQGGGYFCGTCRALCALGGKNGFCEGLKVPVATYGCCNNWRIAPRSEWLGADGRPL